MKTKTKIKLSIAIILIASVVIPVIQNFEILNATYKLCIIEAKLSYYILKQEKASHDLNYYNLKVSNLHSLRGETDNKRRDIATIYLSSQEAINGEYIQFNNL